MNNSQDEQIKKILLVLAQAKDSAPLGYISLHTGIREPLKILREMEEKGLVCQCSPSSWSSCGDPKFNLATTIRKKL